jgi:hypothetical protein
MLHRSTPPGGRRIQGPIETHVVAPEPTSTVTNTNLGRSTEARETFAIDKVAEELHRRIIRDMCDIYQLSNIL